MDTIAPAATGKVQHWTIASSRLKGLQRISDQIGDLHGSYGSRPVPVSGWSEFVSILTVFVQQFFTLLIQGQVGTKTVRKSLTG